MEAAAAEAEAELEAEEEAAAPGTVRLDIEVPDGANVGDRLTYQHSSSCPARRPVARRARTARRPC